MKNKALIEKNQKLCYDLRVKPILLKDIIPHLQEMSNYILELESNLYFSVNKKEEFLDQDRDYLNG